MLARRSARRRWAPYLQNSKLGSAASSYFTASRWRAAKRSGATSDTEFVLTDTPMSTARHRQRRGVRPVAGRTGSCARRRARGFAPHRGEGRCRRRGQLRPPAALQITGAASRRRVFDGTIPFNGFGATADGAPYLIDIKNPAAGVCGRRGTLRCRRITVSPGGQIVSCDPAAPRQETAVRACPERAPRRPQARLLPDRGDGRDPHLRARHPRAWWRMGGTAFRRSPTRNTAPRRAPCRRDRRRDRARHQSHDEATKLATLAAFAHQPTPVPTTMPGTAARSPARRSIPRPHPVLAALRPAPRTRPRHPGLPGPWPSNQQIFIDAPGNFNRVVITLCWRTASDNAWRPAHARDLHQLRPCASSTLHRRASARVASRSSRSWSAWRSA